MMTKEAPASKPYRILVADDHAVVRRGVRALLENQPGLEVCCEASTGLEALEYVKKAKPNLVLLDLTMPEMNGLEAARAIHDESPETDVLILTMHFSEDVAREVLRSGARGYVLKSEGDEQIVRAVEALARHHAYFSDHVSETLLDNFVEQGGSGNNGVSLTAREREVVQLIAEGNSNKKIAHLLSISVKTVETHRSASMRKLDIHSTAELVRYAVRHKLVMP